MTKLLTTKKYVASYGLDMWHGMSF